MRSIKQSGSLLGIPNQYQHPIHPMLIQIHYLATTQKMRCIFSETKKYFSGTVAVIPIERMSFFLYETVRLPTYHFAIYFLYSSTGSTMKKMSNFRKIRNWQAGHSSDILSFLMHVFRLLCRKTACWGRPQSPGIARSAVRLRVRSGRLRTSMNTKNNKT